eukprot:TRINITY_DN37332_c0_g1_i1.p1 TRINITY_DN37332_c0_g1~~TRINITY_DN37332_c0_g1_i1.p1  ORF type:complete len:323 (+),score=63.58 TRINITY_DN37332_c0_g1_i1:115-1083(+)
MPPSMATTLMLEDTLRVKICKDKTQSLGHLKAVGKIPTGSHSPFGDFPNEYMHFQQPRQKMSRSASAPGLTPNAAGRPHTVGNASFGSSAGSTGKLPGLTGTTSPVSSPTNQRPKTSDGPPRAGATIARPIKATLFRVFAERGDLPMNIFHGSSLKLVWKVEVQKLDYHHYLPIFFDGIREKEDPYRFMAVTGAYEMLEKGGEKILPVVPQLIMPLKIALNTRDPQVMCTAMKLLQTLVLSGEMIGEALVPYYRQLLPVFSIFKSHNVPRPQMGDWIDYSQRKRLNLGDLIAETLTILEEHGGEDAFINIKYMIPTYESCMS